MDENQKKSLHGVKAVMKYLKEQGYRCTDVSSRKVSNEKGYDIVAEKGNVILKVEAKCSEKDSGISNCCDTEFDKNKRFIADRLFIVRAKKVGNHYRTTRIQILTKEEINKFRAHHIVKTTIIVASKLINQLFKQKIGQTIQIRK